LKTGLAALYLRPHTTSAKLQRGNFQPIKIAELNLKSKRGGRINQEGTVTEVAAASRRMRE
jgi:hypothetical protein